MNFLDADGLSGEDLAEIDFFAAQTNAAAAGDHDGFVVEGVVDVGQPGVGTWTRLVDLGWAFHAERLVRTLVIKDLDELVEAGLLLQKVGTGRLGGFLLQGQVHALMAAILLRGAGFDSFDTDAQAEPPDGKLAELEQGVGRSEGHAVIAADVCGQAAFAKKPFKDDKSVLLPIGGKRLAGEQETAGVIGHRQWVAVLVIAQQELPFVIGAPELVGPLSGR